MTSTSCATSTSLPAAIDDEFLSDQPGEAQRSDLQTLDPQRPSMLHFFVCTLRLSEHLSKILARFYDGGGDVPGGGLVDLSSDGTSDVASILEFENTLHQFWQTLPAHLRFDTVGNVDAVFERQWRVLRIRWTELCHFL